MDHTAQIASDPLGRISARQLWLLYILAALSFVPNLFQPYLGEEAVYAIVSQEMWLSGEYIVTTLYGEPYARQGLFAWLTQPLISVLGWDYVLVATRFVSAGATVLTGVLLGWFVRRLLKDATLAAFTALVFLSGDTLFIRGWLAYSDPCYALFIFTAMACLWIAVEERRNDFLLLAVVAIAAAVLTKTLTVYAFYGVIGFVLLWQHPNWSFLFNPKSVAIHAVIVALPFVWDWAIPAGPLLQVFAAHISFDLSRSFGAGLLQQAARLLLFPLELIFHLLPLSALAVYCLTDRATARELLAPLYVRIAKWTVLIGIVPYWLAALPSRHLMPLYPFMALVMASLVTCAGEWFRQVSLKALIAAIVIAYAVGIVGFPLYRSIFRGDYRAMATQIIERAAGAPIYSIDDTAFGLSIVANINTLRGPVKPVTRRATSGPGFTISDKPDRTMGHVVMTLKSGRQTRYLLCDPTVCQDK